MENQAEEATYSVIDLGRMLNLSRGMVYSLTRRGVLPAPMPLGPNTVLRWRREVIHEWFARNGEPSTIS
jgi:predicted DNA-binding transcriptional regulator AlpA